MRANRLLLSAAVIGMAGLSACGTITQGGSQTVDVVVKGSPSAFCEFTTQHFRNAGHFPNKLNLERSKDPLTAECKGEQNLYKKFVIQPRAMEKVVAGNAATGLVPGIGYDLGTGGLWEYPNPLIVDFRNADEGEGPKPAWPGDVTDQSRIGTAQIAPPTPVRMQPVMDEQLNPSGQHGNTEVIDAVRLAVDNQQPVAVTTTTTTVPAAKPAARMKPIVSPEDDPAVMKAKQEAKAKAAAEAKRKAAEEKAAAKAAQEAKEAEAAAAKAAQEAKEAADAAAAAEAAQQQAAPAAATPAETPPSDAALTPPSSETPPAAAPAASPSADAAPPAPEAAAPATAAPEAEPKRSPEMPPPAGEPATPASAEEKKSEMPPAAGTGQSTDMDKYLSGGQ